MRVSVLAALCNVCFPLMAAGAGAQSLTMRGWLSDEQCARGRAGSGVYTGTNPDCARQCVEKGAKIVLIVPDRKRVLNIANQAAAKSNIGNYVEVTGEVDPETTALHINSLKMLTEGSAMCDRPRHSPK